MSLILLEGIDRTGKSTVAAYFESLGFQRIHQSAPAKGTSPDDYLQEMVDLVTSAATKDIVLDRSYYGELVWPDVYSRKSLLSDEDISMLREIEDSVGVQRIWMTDNSVEAHWKRCVDNKEPLTKPQFVRARALYSDMAHKYQFEPITLPQFLKKFPDAEPFNNVEALTVQVSGPDKDGNSVTTVIDANQLPVGSTTAKYPPGKSPELHKLEVANAISDVLSKRILKTKGDIYDSIENEMREFLTSKLGKLLGGTNNEPAFSPEEIKFYKAMYKKAIQGDKK